MKLRFNGLVAATLLPLTSLRAQSRDSVAIAAVVSQYLHGLKFNTVDDFRAAFWPQARLFSVKRDSTIREITQEDWYKGFVSSAGKEEEGTLRIAAIDVTGNAAAVKMVETYPTSTYTDYLNLLRLGNSWKIVNKIYVAAARK